MEDEKKTEEPTPEPPKWEHKEEFAITGLTRELVKQAKEATETELDALRRRLERLTYGG